MRALSARNADTAYAVSVGTGAALDGARLVRIMLDGIDMTGTDIRRAEALRYAVSEREAVLAQSHAQEMTLSEVRHCAVSAVLSLTGRSCLCPNISVGISPAQQCKRTDPRPRRGKSATEGSFGRKLIVSDPSVSSLCIKELCVLILSVQWMKGGRPVVARSSSIVQTKPRRRHPLLSRGGTRGQVDNMAEYVRLSAGNRLSSTQRTWQTDRKNV